MDKTVELQLFGDVSLNGLYGNPENLANLRTSLIALQNKMGRGDFRMINWEAPITRLFEFNELKNPLISTTEISATLFCDTFDIDAVCLSNNHIGDCLDEGYLTTTGFFDNRNIPTVGVGESIPEAEELLVTERNGLRIGVLAFIGDETNPRIHPTSNIALCTISDETRMIEMIGNAAKQVDVLMVNLHWGIEFVQYPKSEQKKIAKRCVDAGATIIVGHHSHCLQGVEEYKKGLIFYSLGNFIFSGLRGKETIGWPSFCNRGGAYKVYVAKNHIVSYDFIPFEISNDGVHLDRGIAESVKIQNKLSEQLAVSDSQYGRIYKMNVMLNWFVRLPRFLIKSKGGVFSAIGQYASPKYLRLFLSYFTKR